MSSQICSFLINSSKLHRYFGKISTAFRSNGPKFGTYSYEIQFSTCIRSMFNKVSIHLIDNSQGKSLRQTWTEQKSINGKYSYKSFSKLNKMKIIIERSNVDLYWTVSPYFHISCGKLDSKQTESNNMSLQIALA